MALQTQDPSQAVITSVGAALNGGTANSTTPVITGTADVGDIVSIYDGVRLLGTALVGVNGTWSFTPTVALKGGSHSFAAIAQDSKGNFGASSVPLTVQVGSTVVAPAAPGITALTDNVGTKTGPITNGTMTDDSRPVLTGTGTAGNTITLYDGATVIGSATVAGNGTWSVQPATALINGTHDLYATQTNAAGTSPHSTDISFTVNTTTPATPAAPTTTDDSGNAIAAGSTTADAHPHIHGKGTNGDTITVYDNGVVIGSTTVAPDGTWTFTPSPDLPNGSNSITVIETNPAGTSSASSAPIVVVVDTTTPAKPSTPVLTDDSNASIPAGSTTTDGHPHISGTGTAGNIVKVYDGATPIGSAVVDVTGKWTFTPSTDMASGTHTITATQTNAAGTTGAASAAIAFTFTPVATVPVITLLHEYNGSVDVKSVPSGSTTPYTGNVIYGTAHYGDTISVYDGASLLGSVGVSVDGSWWIGSGITWASGVHTITATAKTSGGVTSTVSNTFTFTVNTSTPATPAAPTFTDDSGNAIAAGGATADPHPHINGKGTAGDIITVSDNGAVIGSTTVANDGTWSFTPSTDMAAGNNSITVTETNPAGTSSAASTPVVITVVTTAPATPAAPTFTDDAGAAIPAGSTTPDAAPHINGKGTAGDTITVYDGTTVLGTAVVNSNGTWTFQPATALSSAAHSISVTESNVAGTSAKSAASTVTVGIPSHSIVITGVYDQDGLLIANNGSMTGTITVKGAVIGYAAGDTVQIFVAGDHISGSGRPSITVTVGPDGTFSQTFSATTTFADNTPVFLAGTAPGKTTFTAIDYPATGSSYKSADYVVNDTSWTHTGTAPATPAAPTMTDDSGAAIAAGATTSDSHPHFNGTGTSGDIIKVYDGATLLGSATVAPNGQWTFSPSTDFSSGPHSVYVTESNASGTSAASAPIAFTFAVAAPATPAAPTLTDDSGVAITSGTTTDGHPHINGTGTSGDIIKVYDGATVIGSTTVGTDGKWTFMPAADLSVGSHDLYVVESNAAGSATSPHVPLTVNLPLVIYGIGTAAGDLSYAREVLISSGGTTITGGVADLAGSGTVGAVIRIYRDGSLLSTTTVDATGKWGGTSKANYDYPPNGVHTYTVTQTVGGVTSAPSAGCVLNVGGSVVINGVPAVPTITNDSGVVILGNTTTQSAHLSFSGTSSPTGNDIITLYDGSTAIGSVTADQNGKWKIAPTANFANGAHDFYITDLPSIVAGGSYLPGTSLHVPLTVATGLSSMLQPTSSDATDDTAQAASGVDSTQPDHHTVVGEHDAFIGTAANGNETVDLNADPASYFKETTAHIQGSGGTAIDTLHLTGDHQVLDLTSLTGQTAAAKISGIEVIDLGGHANNLKLSLTDVLNLGEQDLFQKDGHQQLMVKGSNGDTVDLSNAHIAGVADGQWQAEGTAVVGGVTYNVYEHSGAHTELLVQQGVQIALHN
ncbi:Ig-like domain-containing protein [Caballeronia sp. LjRoot31]|uniref:beta strand repeat-containing protein n=1 Tax=Caballeronia sp. LjRoot31 TaxID=3342324 RepID=UPI003ECF4B36